MGLYEPDFIVAIRSGALESVQLDELPADVGGIHLLRAADRTPAAKTRAMSEFLLSVFAQHVPWFID